MQSTHCLNKIFFLLMFLKFINYYYCNSRAKDSSELHFFGFSTFHHFRQNGPFVQTILAGNRKYVDNFVSSFQEPHDKFSDVIFFLYIVTQGSTWTLVRYQWKKIHRQVNYCQYLSDRTSDFWGHIVEKIFFSRVVFFLVFQLCLWRKLQIPVVILKQSFRIEIFWTSKICVRTSNYHHRHLSEWTRG